MWTPHTPAARVVFAVGVFLLGVLIGQLIIWLDGDPPAGSSPDPVTDKAPPSGDAASRVYDAAQGDGRRRRVERAVQGSDRVGEAEGEDTTEGDHARQDPAISEVALKHPWESRAPSSAWQDGSVVATEQCMSDVMVKFVLNKDKNATDTFTKRARTALGVTEPLHLRFWRSNVARLERTGPAPWDSARFQIVGSLTDEEIQYWRGYESVSGRDFLPIASADQSIAWEEEQRGRALDPAVRERLLRDLQNLAERRRDELVAVFESLDTLAVDTTASTHAVGYAVIDRQLYLCDDRSTPRVREAASDITELRDRFAALLDEFFNE